MKFLDVFKGMPRRRLTAEIELELNFHVERLYEQNLATGMDPAGARREALASFGNISEITRDCVRIRERGCAFVRSFRGFLIAVFCVGLVARVFGTNLYEIQVGNMLMLIATASWTLVRFLRLRRSSLTPFGLERPLGLE